MGPLTRWHAGQGGVHGKKNRFGTRLGNKNLRKMVLESCGLEKFQKIRSRGQKQWFFVPGVSIFVCTFSLGAIAVDRYKLVVCPHSKPLSKKGAAHVIAMMWIISVFVTLPYAFYMQHVSYEVCFLHL